MRLGFSLAELVVRFPLCAILPRRLDAGLTIRCRNGFHEDNWNRYLINTPNNRLKGG